VIADDTRIVAFNRLLRFGYIAHFVREWVTLRPFWTSDFRDEFSAFGSPAGARTALAFFSIAAATNLVCSMLAVWQQPSRRVIWLSTLALIVEAIAMPIAIPNHIALMLAAMTFQAVLLLWRDDEAWTVRGLTAILITAYASAAVHKMNTGFLGVLDGILGHRLPRAISSFLGICAVLFELLVPIIALLSRRARPLFLLGLLALHFPMNSTLGAIDYPWIATSFYPLFFTRDEWTRIVAELREQRSINWLGAGASLLLFVALTPRSDLVIYQAAIGAIVSLLWGYAIPTLMRRVLPGS
jgi:hypothetical protein